MEGSMEGSIEMFDEMFDGMPYAADIRAYRVASSE